MSRECRDWEGGRVDLETKAINEGNSDRNDAVIYTDGSVVRGHIRFSAQVRGGVSEEQSWAYHVTPLTIRMDIEAVTAAL